LTVRLLWRLFYYERHEGEANLKSRSDRAPVKNCVYIIVAKPTLMIKLFQQTALVYFVLITLRELKKKCTRFLG
jgi:hypothetical protein